MIGVVTGSRAEARCLGRLEVAVACSGARPARARSEAARLIARGAAGLVSFGLAGGLAPAAASGELVLADAVVLPDGARIATDAAWRRHLLTALRAAGARPHVAPVAGSDRLLTTAAAKRALFEAIGALAVDMESHAVAAVATHAGIPFLVLRALADPFDQTVPQVAREALRPDGAIRIRATFGGLLRQPGQLIELARLARQSALALAALRRGARFAGPRLGFTPYGE